MRRWQPALLCVLILALGNPAGAAAAAPQTCDQVPEPSRWLAAGQPDPGADNAIVSVHRGANLLAPENTMAAFEHAFAYGAEMVEADVRETADGRYVVFHDSTVDAKTDGSGAIESMTYAQVRALNAAAYPPWSGTVHDPAQIPPLEEVLALARRVGGGVEFDIKSVRDHTAVAALAAEYGLLERSMFNSADARIKATHPQARLIYNRDRVEPRGSLYTLGSTVYTFFGSRLDEYSAESIAEIHDACGLVVPHAYDGTYGDEHADIQAARTMGVDGVQVNAPDIAAAALGEPVPTEVRVVGSTVCVVNADNGLGLPAKPVTITDTGGTAGMVVTGHDGCVQLAAPPRSAAFSGDASALASDAVDRAAVVALRHAHAHNDYEHPRPLLDALSHGFTSVEADIYLVGDDLLVGHDPDDLRPGRTLQALYLDPLRERVTVQQGGVYGPDGPPLQLLVDIKTEHHSTYLRLDALLREYADVLTRFGTGGVVEPGPVEVVVSGNRPREYMALQSDRFAGYDGRLSDLSSNDTAAFMPLISDNWGLHFSWRGDGEMPADQRQRLREIVSGAHARGRRVRFWATPDAPGPQREAVWRELLRAGVDHLNTDDLQGLRAFLQAEGGGAAG